MGLVVMLWLIWDTMELLLEKSPVLIAGPDPQDRCLEILHVCFVPH